MTDHVLTFTFSADAPDVSSVVDATVSDLQALGHTVTAVRLTDDTGEQTLDIAPSDELPPDEVPPEEPPPEEVP